MKSSRRVAADDAFDDTEGGREDEERRSGDLTSVRGPTGRWNPRSRLIAIKAPLRLRL
ncbi:hypothetical protein ALC62_14525 [Cyphomyrmex costatus]|uniref:Uncharacterized protein n=1 Tax=Cyphomyrmex costatus TaxID=456900 RepID=A0A195C2W0_9HYME|nr:hypothetical protein ALC62_14525 [Cyphomyrmex costatus]